MKKTSETSSDAIQRRVERATESPTAWQVDVRLLPPGYYLGGNAGRLTQCPVCKDSAVRLRDVQRKGRPHARFAHKLTITLRANNEPTVRYTERHTDPEPRADARPTTGAPTNDNGAKHAV